MQFDFKYFVTLKLRVFERRFLPKKGLLGFLSKSWPFFKRSVMRNHLNIFNELEDEFVPTDYVHMHYVVFYGWLSLLIILFATIFSVWLIDIFPFYISDMFLQISEFLWVYPVVTLLFTSFFGIFILSFIPANRIVEIQNVSFFISVILLFSIIFLFARFDFSTEDLQFAYRFSLDFKDDISNPFIETTVRNYNFASLIFNFHIAVDGISLVLIFLTIFLFLICDLLNFYSNVTFSKESAILFQFLQFLVLFAFSTFDIVVFYVVFEAVLIPMFLIIGLFGGRSRKIYAAFKLFLYTLVCSLFTLIGLVLLTFCTTSTDLEFLSTIFIADDLQKLLFFLLFMSFAVKLPMVPFHLWLPEAHVEASTTGSIILAGILLKLGGYGFIRFLLPILPYGFSFFSPLIALLSCVAIILGSLVAIRQIDLKKIIAYSSIAHMGLVTLALAMPHKLSFTAAVFILVNHGFVASALFMLVGTIYERYKTKLIVYYSGLATTMPIFSLFFFLFSLANIALPGTSAFIGEFLAFAGIASNSIFFLFFAVFSVVLVVCYTLWLFNRVCFGQLSTQYIQFYQDLTLVEFSILLVFFLPVIFFGISPSSFFDIIFFDLANFEADLFFKV